MNRALRCGLPMLPLLLAFAGCGGGDTKQDELVPSVSVAEVEAVDLKEEIRASGDLNARLHTTIAAEVEGRITAITVDEGGSVEKGAVVIEIDPARRRLEVGASRAQLAQAQANYTNQKRQAERIRKLHTQNVSSEQKLDEAETALVLARSQVQAQRAALGVIERALDDASVSAPFAGMIARRTVQLGEFVQPGKPLVELVALDPLEVVFSLSELDSERVRPDQQVDVTVAALPDRVFQGKVTFVAPTVDVATRTLRIKAEIENSDRLLRPGLFARVSLGVSPRSGVVMVPEEALIQRAEGALLFKIGPENRVKRVVVTTGARDGGRVEVRGDVSPGELVVRRGHGGLVDGAVVAVHSEPRAVAAQPGEGAEGAAL